MLEAVKGDKNCEDMIVIADMCLSMNTKFGRNTRYHVDDYILKK